MEHRFRSSAFWDGSVFGVAVGCIATLALVWFWDADQPPNFSSRLYYACLLLVPLFSALIGYRGIMKQVRLQALYKERAGAIGNMIDKFSAAEVEAQKGQAILFPDDRKSNKWTEFQFAATQAQLYVSEAGFQQVEAILRFDPKTQNGELVLKEFWKAMRSEVRKKID